VKTHRSTHAPAATQIGPNAGRTVRGVDGIGFAHR
jgi:hypothetical protein